jgi:serine/threonine protein kinase/tetratricopeptide (TPR) repeat protein
MLVNCPRIPQSEAVDDPPGEGAQLGEGGRYRLGRKLGAGGMGVVREADDRERGAAVALKLLRRADPDSVFRFKREFRALTDLHHENLVSLYDLVAEGDRWFFTMELVEGVDFVTWVRGPSASEDEGAPTLAIGMSGPANPQTGAGAGAGPPAPGAEPMIIDDRRTADLERLRSGLVQLVRGLMALHRSGHLHRDIKPSNVLVTARGRVVLLDFGVVAELDAFDPEAGREVVGTPAYMAPEQGLGETAGPASDWYAVGVLLFEALTGRRPFERSRADVLTDKLIMTPPAPGEYARDTPADLDRLCVELLRREPTERPTGEQILARLSVGDAPSEPAPAPFMHTDELVLFGRRDALDRLRVAFAATRRGAHVARARGASGTGKTALIKRFLRHVEGYGALVLAGRCYERESVPFKALDPIVDELCQWLLSMEPEQVAQLLPADAHLLAQLFPVLRRVPSLDFESSSGVYSAAAPGEVRRRAARALRELLGRIAARRSVVVFIDDVQWGDAESVPLLEGVLRPPRPPAVLWIVCHRAEGTLGPVVAALRDPPPSVGHTEIEIDPLSESDARALAEYVLRRAGAATSSAADIAREAGGNPFFIHEMARAQAEAPLREGDAVQLGPMIRARVAQLPPADRRIVETVAVAASPLPRDVAFEAAELSAEDRLGVLARLVRMQLLRGVAGTMVECYHDRIRESVVAGLDAPARTESHRRLADALEATGHADPQTLAEHRQAAGQLAQAAGHARAAAWAAAEALAFERAATLLQLALELDPNSEHELTLRRQLAEAWANAGRGGEAGQAYLAAAEHTDDLQLAGDLRREAGEQFVRAGQVQRGMVLLEETLARYGLKMPKSGVRAIASLLTQRALLHLRGLDFDPRSAADVPEQQLQRTDACWSAAIGLVQIEPIIGSVFATRHLRAALDAGEPFRVGRGFVLEALLRSAGGSKAREPTLALLQRARTIADNHHNPLLGLLVQLAGGVTSFELGDFREAFARCETALADFERESVAGHWEQGQVELFGSLAGLFCGHYGRIGERMPQRLAQAEARGDVYTTTCLRTSITPVVALATRDDPARAYREIDEALAQWNRDETFENQHYMAFIAGACTDLYSGDLDGALARCERTDAAMRGNLLAHVQVIRGTWRFMRSLCRLRGARRGDTAALLRSVAGDARRLAREGAGWCEGAASLLRAGLALHRGDRDDARQQLRLADERLGEVGFEQFRQPARWRLGELLGGDEGRKLRAEVLEDLRRAGVAKPQRFAEAFTIGTDR